MQRLGGPVASAAGGPGQVLLEGDGRPRDFRTEDPWADLPGGLVRATWSMPVQRWTTAVDGRVRLASGAAEWLLPDGRFRYAEMSLADLALDVPP